MTGKCQECYPQGNQRSVRETAFNHTCNQYHWVSIAMSHGILVDIVIGMRPKRTLGVRGLGPSLIQQPHRAWERPQANSVQDQAQRQWPEEKPNFCLRGPLGPCREDRWLTKQNQKYELQLNWISVSETMILICYDKTPSMGNTQEMLLVIFNKVNRFPCVREEVINNRKL